jgi:hypothetical protein
MKLGLHNNLIKASAAKEKDALISNDGMNILDNFTGDHNLIRSL